MSLSSIILGYAVSATTLLLFVVGFDLNLTDTVCFAASYHFQYFPPIAPTSNLLSSEHRGSVLVAAVTFELFAGQVYFVVCLWCKVQA